MRLVFASAVLAAALLLAASCSPPTNYTATTMRALDLHTDYAIDERPGGFTLTLRYTQLQYHDEPALLAAACERNFASAAQALAERRGRAIRPQGEQSLQMSFARNSITGQSFCTASALVLYR